MLAGLRIVGLTIAACILYGLIHDQITIRISLEYFTVCHPKIVPWTDPTRLALAWGVVATWWMGAILGVPLALAARVGTWPKRTWRDLVRPLATTLAVVGACALTVGLLAWFGHTTWPTLLGVPAVPRDRWRAVGTAWLIHGTSYFVGLLAGLSLAGVTFIGRVLQAHQQEPARLPRTLAP